MKKIINVLAAATLVSSLAPSAVGLDDHNPIGVSGAFEGIVATGCAYNVLNHNATRQIDDIVVPGSIGKYPLKMTRYYNSRETTYPGRIAPGWSHEYQWRFNSNTQKVTYPNGNVWEVGCFPDENTPLGVSDGWQTLTYGQNGFTGDFRLADGGTVHFQPSNAAGTWHTVVTAISDPYGQTTTITYDSISGLLTRVTEPGGRYLQFSYTTVNGALMLHEVDAYDGVAGHSRLDYVVYNYTSTSPGGQYGPPVNCLTRVDYSDGQHAYYGYTSDNVPDHPNLGSTKVLPLVKTCNDVRYHGPMRQIEYEYQDQGPHGAIIKEKYSPGGTMVSKIEPGCPSPTNETPNFETTYTETRGDGPTRKFTYTELHLTRSHGEPEACPILFRGPAPQQFLQAYTDFQGHTTELNYDENWYVNSLTDANGHTTQYDRGPPPNAHTGQRGIGEIKKITHSDGYFIQYGYYDEGGSRIGGHYLTQITDERGNKTIHTRDQNTQQITKTEHWDADNNLLAYEEFWYNSFGQVRTQHLPTSALKNGAYVHFQYDTRGLLIKRWNPTTTASYPPADTEPHTTYTYYGANDHTINGESVGNAWIDRVKTMALPVNANGLQATESYEYDRNGSGQPCPGRGLVTKIQHADLKFQSFGYDAYGNKSWEENELSQRTSYTYDDYNRVLTVKDPIGQVTDHKTIYTYKPTIGTGSSFTHTTSNPDTITTPANIQTTNAYDENFRKLSTTTGSSTTSFGYDDVGNPTTVTDPLDHTTTTVYDERNRKKKVINALYQTTIFGYDPASNITSITRPDNLVEAKAYDGMNRLTIDIMPKSSAESLITTFGYWPSGKLFWVQDPKQQGKGPDAATYFEYNDSDEQIRMWYPGRSQKQEWTYDNAHNLVSHTTVGGKIEQFSYDIRNRKDTMTCGSGDPIQWIEWADYGYDDVGRLTSAKNGTGIWSQNVISTVTRVYDDAGRLTLDQQSVNGLGTYNVSYPLYDDDGRLKQISVTGAGYDYTFDYDSMGRFEKIKSGGSVAFQYYYDTASNEIQRRNYLTTPDLDQFYNRDSLNRIWRLDVKKGASLIGREDYGYDSMGRLVSVTREDNKQDQFGYYWDGELLGVVYGADPTPTPSPIGSPSPTPPGGQVIEPTFRPNGYNVYPNNEATVTISTTTAGAQIRYTLDGTNWTTIANNSTITFVVGIAGKTLTAIGFKSGMADSDPHSDYYYRENPGSPYTGKNSLTRSGSVGKNAGRPPTISDLVSGALSPDSIDATDAPFRAVVYYYDGAGNRTSMNDNGIITTYTATPLNQYDTVTGTIIANGLEHEVSSYQGPLDAQPVNYTYRSDKDLVLVNSGSNSYSLAYDALGRCVKRTLNGAMTFYVYDGEKPILEYKAGDLGHPTKNLYGKGIDEILMRNEYGINGSQPFYYQQDHEGSVTHLTNATGVVIERYRYDVFGNPVTIYSAGTYNNRFKFTGREFNATFGFYEYRARAYHPILGRFMSEDPKLFDPGDYNLFRYCHNDPIDMTDPMGTDPPGAYSAREESFKRADITIAERISLWQQSMESSIAGELALNAVRITDALSRQLGQGSFQDEHIEFRPTGKTATSTSGNPITQGRVFYYVNGEPIASYPANSGGFKSKDSLVVGNDTRTPAGHYLGKNFRERYDKAGMIREGVGFSLDLDPLFYTNRTLLRMHPDGRSPGSEGCGALSCGESGLRDFQSRVSGYLSHSPFIDVYVGY